MGKKKKKKSRFRRFLTWLIVDVVVAVIVLLLLFHKPGHYHPAAPAAGSDDQAVHPYLSHDLVPQFYNDAQDRKPFEMVILDKSLNEAIAQMKWPQEQAGASFSAPKVLFQPGRAVVMGTATARGVELVMTLALEPRWDDNGHFGFEVKKVKIGAMNITPLAKMLAKRQYQQRLETVPVDTSTVQAKIAAALLNQETFDPVFEVEDKWVRLEALEITEGKLTARFVPASGPVRTPRSTSARP